MAQLRHVSPLYDTDNFTVTYTNGGVIPAYSSTRATQVTHGARYCQHQKAAHVYDRVRADNAADMTGFCDPNANDWNPRHVCNGCNNGAYSTGNNTVCVSCPANSFHYLIAATSILTCTCVPVVRCCRRLQC